MRRALIALTLATTCTATQPPDDDPARPDAAPCAPPPCPAEVDGCDVRRLVGDPTSCDARCEWVTTTEFADGDGCCPDGERYQDSDCPAVCGNDQLEEAESCDGSCPETLADCDDDIPCTDDAIEGEDCETVCRHTEVTVAFAGDACCPAGTDSFTDADCPTTCGNGIVEPGETCDVALPASCPTPAICDDFDDCTVDAIISDGTCNAACGHDAITAFIQHDACCPPGADASVDVDCRYW